MNRRIHDIDFNHAFALLPFESKNFFLKTIVNISRVTGSWFSPRFVKLQISSIRVSLSLNWVTYLKIPKIIFFLKKTLTIMIQNICSSPAVNKLTFRCAVAEIIYSVRFFPSIIHIFYFNWNFDSLGKSFLRIYQKQNVNPLWWF